MIGSLFIAGPAGTGKSTFAGAFNDWLISQGFDSIIVNLDPGSDFMPYNPEIDIKEKISLNDIMSNYSLGPNGAQIVAADMILENVNYIKEKLENYPDYYVIFDTPGQIELFSFRPSSPYLVKALTNNKAMIAFVSDAVVSSMPSGYISEKMLYASLYSRFYVPMLFILNKIDLIGSEKVDEIIKWEDDPDILLDAFREEKGDMLKDYFENIVQALSNSGIMNKIYPVSSKDSFGMEDVYSEISNFFTGGEDTDTMYRDD